MSTLWLKIFRYGPSEYVARRFAVTRTGAQ
ncbi:DUF418 domain-containing protein [uncultured Kocuria sp.]|nr:DUF418 domain-containing protein [Kocuria sp. HSID16901]